MAGRRLMTLDARELLRRLRAGQSQREIARDLSIDRKTVRKYRRFALRQGFLEGELPKPGELDLCLNGCSGKGLGSRNVGDYSVGSVGIGGRFRSE